MHPVIDDHSRLVYCEVHDDQTALTATAVLVRAVAWSAAQGVTIERVLSDNGPAYKPHLWHTVCDQHSITVSKTRPYRPQTNGEVERLNRTLADGWAHARCHACEQERRDALAGWIHFHNHHQPHTAPDGLTPASRVHNLTGNYN